MYESGERLPRGRAITTASDRSLMLQAEQAQDDGVEKSINALDSEHALALHDRHMSFFERELEIQANNRAEMALDHEFYDNYQFDEEELRILEERGQKPIVQNVIATTIDWVTGTEKRTRTDYKLLARRKEFSNHAQRKTDVLKYLSDVNDTRFHRSDAFADAVKGGVGWLEDGIQADDDGELIYSGGVSWRDILWDSASCSSSQKDVENGRYMYRNKWVDLDWAEAMFPKRKHILQSSVQVSTSLGAFDMEFGDEHMDAQEESAFDAASISSVSGWDRFRVRLIEGWFKRPEMVMRMKGGQFHGEIFDEWRRGHIEDLNAGDAELVERPGFRTYLGIMTYGGWLYLDKSPYLHNRYPFTPVWGYRRDKNNLPYGIIRRMRGLQRDINWRAVKALHILSANKVIMDDDAVEDVDKLLEEASRPDAVIVKKKGSELKLDADRDLAPAHIQLMQHSIQMIQAASGVTDENLGRTTNATSGIAIDRRQDQGALATAGLFDNLQYARKKQGEKQTALIEQFMPEKKEIRITNQRGTPDYMTINSGEPDDDITRSKADFVISEDEWRASVRQAQVDELLALARELASTAPQLVLIMLDLIVEQMDIPNRDELVARIRQITGMSDPDQEEPTPEQQARAAEEQQAKELQMRGMIAQIVKDEADARAKEAQAEKTAAEVARANVGAQKEAMETALVATQAPAIVPVADGILAESGFEGETQKRDKAEVEAKAQALEQAALEGAAMEQEAAATGAVPSGATNQPVQR